MSSPDNLDLDLKSALQGLRPDPLACPCGDTPPGEPAPVCPIHTTIHSTPRPRPKRGPKPKTHNPMDTRVGGDDLREGAEIIKREQALMVIPPTGVVPGGAGEKGTNACPEGAPPSYIYNIEESTVQVTEKEVIDNKEELTERELKFIRLTTIDGIPPITALIASGYKKRGDQASYYLARQIKKKYECLAEGREIFSDLDFGPVEIAQGIIAIAQGCLNQQVRLNALALAAKATGLLRDAIEQQPGVTIVIKGRDQGSDAPGGREPAPYRPTGPAVAVQVNGPVALVR